jgi:hypothetical protein
MTDKPFECPRCGASTETEAELMCIPIESECPMTVREDWDEAVAIVRREMEVAALPSDTTKDPK